jgi:hypothetical protein
MGGEVNGTEALARSAEVLSAASRELAGLVALIRRMVEAVVLRDLALGHRPEITSGAVRSVIAAHSLRDEYLGASVDDVAWSLLLEAYAARLEGRLVSMTELGAAAGVSQTTAHEWIHRLLDRGLLLRLPDPEDEQVAMIDLSDDGADRMRDYLSAALRLSPWVS